MSDYKPPERNDEQVTQDSKRRAIERVAGAKKVEKPDLIKNEKPREVIADATKNEKPREVIADEKPGSAKIQAFDTPKSVALDNADRTNMITRDQSKTDESRDSQIPSMLEIADENQEELKARGTKEFKVGQITASAERKRDLEYQEKLEQEQRDAAPKPPIQPGVGDRLGEPGKLLIETIAIDKGIGVLAQTASRLRNAISIRLRQRTIGRAGDAIATATEAAAKSSIQAPSKGVEVKGPWTQEQIRDQVRDAYVAGRKAGLSPKEAREMGVESLNTTYKAYIKQGLSPKEAFEKTGEVMKAAREAPALKPSLPQGSTRKSPNMGREKKYEYVPPDLDNFGNTFEEKFRKKVRKNVQNR